MNLVDDDDDMAVAKNGSAKRRVDSAHGWFSRKSMAEIFDVAPQVFDSTYRKYAGKDAVRRDGRRLLFHARSLINAWIEAKHAHHPDPDEDSELLRGEDSPAMERLRLAKAKLAELELARRINTLVPRDEVRTGLLRLASRLRNFGETLQRTHGPQALDLFDEALSDCEDEIDAMFGDDDDDEDSDSKE